jgi:catecholate siderophore receptor
MIDVASSIEGGAFSHRDHVPQVLKNKNGEIRVQISSRARLTTAVSLASVMAASTAGAQEGLQLPTIDVTGDQGAGYQATQQTISRLPTRLIDTPQTVNVVTQQVIQDQRATSMEEALRNVPGITFSAGEGGQQGDSPYIRGQTARGDIFRDGIRDPGWYTRDLFGVDRVEVYKGPSAFAFGRGPTGGAINNSSKLPNGATFAETTATGSSAGGFRLEGDAGGKVGNVAGRIAVMTQDYDTADRDNVWTKRWGVAPSATVDLNDQTKATLSYRYQGEESVPDYGHPWLPAPTSSAQTGAQTGGYNGNGTAVTPVPVPRSNWYGFTGNLKDLVQTDTHILTAKLEHRFNDAVTVSNATRYISVKRMARPTAPRSLGLAGQLTGTPTTPPAGYPVEQMTIGRQHFQTDTDNTLLLNQTDLLAKFGIFGLQHTLVAGVEISRETRWQQRANLCSPTGGSACRTSLWDPDPNASAGTFTVFGAPNETLQNTVAFYASDQIKLNQYFELLGAMRYDVFSTDYTSGAPATTLSRSDNLLSYRFGGVYHPLPNVSLYVAYGNSYNPSAELGTLGPDPDDTNSVLLEPEKNITYEAGAKVDVLGGMLSLTGAVFRTEKTNMRIPSEPITGAAIVLDGLARIDGIELGIAGKVTDKWNVSVGFSHLNSEIVETTNLDQKGKQLPNTPPNNFTFWSTYDVTPQWTVGGGAFYQDEAYANAQNTLYVPSWWRFDAMASYKINPKMTLQLNVYNITDEFYYAQYYGGHAVPAAGRYATLSLKTSW